MSEGAEDTEGHEGVLEDFQLKIGVYGELYPTMWKALKAAETSSRPEVRKLMAALRAARARRDDDREYRLKTAFGLTSAEVRLTLYLVLGGSVQGYAETCGLGMSTVRSHLKSIYAKTGVDRQARLADLLSGNQGPGQPKTQF